MNTHFILTDLAALSAPAIGGGPKRARTDDGFAAVDAIEEIEVSDDEEPMAEPMAKKAKPTDIGSIDEDEEERAGARMIIIEHRARGDDKDDVKN